MSLVLKKMYNEYTIFAENRGIYKIKSEHDYRTLDNDF